MPYYLSLAFKNIFRQKKRSFTLGVNYFVVAILMLLLLSFSDGVKKNFSGNLISAAAGHLTLSGAVVTKGKTLIGVADYPTIVKVIEAEYPDATVLARYKLTSTVYYLGQSKSLSFQGIDTAKDTALKDQLSFVAGSWDDYVAQNNGVLISKDTADYLKLKLDDEVVISTRTRFGAFNTGTIRVKGIYESANYFVQGIVLCHFGFLQALDLNDKLSASSLFVYFKNTDGLEAKREHLLGALADAGYVTSKPASSSDAISVVAAATPQYKVEGADVNEYRLTIATVNEVIAILAQVLDAVNAAGGFLAGIMLFIIAISIFINMRMTINDRMQEIGTLRAIGTETKDIVLMLIFENVFLSLLFVLAGLATALLIIAFVSNVLSLPPAGILSLFLDQGHLVLIPTLGSLSLILAVAFVFTGLFSFFPARHGGKVRAAVALSKTY
ncbi:MAG: FtsX-like permease family protein [Spirochaetales bacterium]